MKMEQHLTIVAVLHICFGILFLIIGAIVFITLIGAGILSGDNEALAITSVIGIAVGGFFGILSLPEIIGGIGLLKRKNWARIVLLIIACFDLLNIPIGTAIGIYSLWVLLHDETIKLFA